MVIAAMEHGSDQRGQEDRDGLHVHPTQNTGFTWRPDMAS